LIRRLADLFPGANHVFRLNLHEADDLRIWDYAEANGFTIVTKDSDFSDRSMLLGHPPKVIRLHLGNCSTNAVEALLRDHCATIIAFERESERSCLHLPPVAWHE
jgi:predicted nuclease of predicted toxin-antitoxin system